LPISAPPYTSDSPESSLVRELEGFLIDLQLIKAGKKDRPESEETGSWQPERVAVDSTGNESNELHKNCVNSAGLCVMDSAKRKARRETCL